MPDERPFQTSARPPDEFLQARRATRQALGAVIFLALVTAAARLI